MKFFSTLLFLASFAAMANPCQSDLQKFCPGVKPGQGQVSKCLYENRESLSKACKNEIQNQIGQTNKRNPCHNNLVEFCSDMPLEGEKLTYCLLKNETKLDQECASDFRPKKEKFMKNNPCAPELAEHCYAELKGPRVEATRCLMKNRAKASKTCQPHVDKLVSTLKEKNSCFDEIEKFCTREKGPAEVQTCLEKKKLSLSPKCSAAVDKRAAKVKSHPCHQDVTTLCKTALTPANKQRCLTTYEKKLSPACREYRSSRTQRLSKIVSFCEADRVKHCSMVQKNSGKVLRCLKLNKDKLTPTCKAQL